MPDQSFVASQFTAVSLDFVSLGWKKSSLEMETLYDSPYFLMYIRSFEVIFSYNKTNLRDIYSFKVDNENTRTRCENCFKLKLKNKYINDLTSEHHISCNLFFSKFLTPKIKPRG